MSVKKDCTPPLTTDGSQVECKAVFQNLTTCDEGSGSQPAAVINGTVTNQIQNSPASTTTAPVCYAALACSDPGQPGSCTPDLVGGALPQPYGLAAGDGNAGGPDTIVCLMTEQINVSDKGYCDDGNVDTPNEQACDPAAPSCGAGETCVAIECVANAGIKVQDRAVFRGVAQPDPTTDVSGSPEANVQVKCCGDQFVNVVGEYCDTDPHGTIPGPAGELAQECPNPNPLVPVGDEGNNDFGCLANIDQACRAPGTDGECTLCGDGVRQDVPFEQCDRDDFKTGAPAGSGPCRATGVNACTFCGDGDDTNDDPGQTCDDGVLTGIGNDGKCRGAGQGPGFPECTLCGDDVKQGGENCDPGTTPATGNVGCRADCTECGDGVLQDPPESCDGAALRQTDAAQAGRNETCRASGPDVCTFCGDGVTQTGEKCDDGVLAESGNAYKQCRGTQALAPACTTCGDGTEDAGEACDPGDNPVAGNVGCRDDCTECGDGVLQDPPESCDGAALRQTDAAQAGLNAACRTSGANICTFCGDGDDTNDDPGQTCDDGKLASTDTTDPKAKKDGQCRPATLGAQYACTFCGDKITQAIEECDPANPNDPITQAGQCQADCTRKLECKVTLDKQVSGNGVGNYKDVGDFPPGRIVGMATGWTDEDASHQFVVKNDTDPALGAKLKCVLTDYRGSAAATGPVIHEFPPFDLDPGKSTTLKWTGTCNEGEKETDLEGPDVAKVKCDCVDPIDGSDTGDDVSDEDEAKLVCQTPGPNVTKLCEEEPGGTFKFIITGSNPGSVCDGTNDGCEVAGDCEGVACVAVDAATLINCKAVDTTYPGTCPATFCPDGTPCTMDSQCAPEKCLEGTPIYGPETIPFVPSTLKPGDTAQADKTGVTLSETSCNKVTMECEVLDVDAPGGGCVPDPTGGCKKFTAEAEDDCPVSDLICRTPGFWGTHGGIEKGSKSKNITQAVIDSIGTDGCIEVCGENINNTKVGSDASALEAMCVSPRGDQRLQLVRQLTAMALNCIVSGIGPDCAGDGALDTLFSECSETVCRDDKEGATYKSVGQCIGTIDCFNNGGIVGGGACKPTPDGEPSCHTEPLPEEFLLNGRPGAAGSSGACKDAREAGSCTVIKSDSTSGTEANCTKPIDAEVCAP
jgi:hypothetical protein